MKAAAVLLVSIFVAGCSAGFSTGRAGWTSSRPVTRVDTASEEAYGLFGRDWIFVEVDGYDGPLPSPPPIAGFILTREGGHVRGTTACNGFSAGYEVDEAAGILHFTSLRNTRMLCDRVASDTEEAVLSAMIATDGYRLDGNRLELLSRGSVVARLMTQD